MLNEIGDLRGEEGVIVEEKSYNAENERREKQPHELGDPL